MKVLWLGHVQMKIRFSNDVEYRGSNEFCLYFKVEDRQLYANADFPETFAKQSCVINPSRRVVGCPSQYPPTPFLLDFWPDTHSAR